MSASALRGVEAMSSALGDPTGSVERRTRSMRGCPRSCRERPREDAAARSRESRCSPDGHASARNVLRYRIAKTREGSSCRSRIIVSAHSPDVRRMASAGAVGCGLDRGSNLQFANRIVRMYERPPLGVCLVPSRPQGIQIYDQRDPRAFPDNAGAWHAYWRVRCVRAPGEAGFRCFATPPPRGAPEAGAPLAETMCRSVKVDGVATTHRSHPERRERFMRTTGCRHRPIEPCAIHVLSVSPLKTRRTACRATAPLTLVPSPVMRKVCKGSRRGLVQ
jgi:hypothetical protein